MKTLKGNLKSQGVACDKRVPRLFGNGSSFFSDSCKRVATATK